MEVYSARGLECKRRAISGHVESKKSKREQKGRYSTEKRRDKK